MAAPRNAGIQSKILHSCETLLQSTSFADISLAAIAAKAGVSKGTVYHYYKSKNDILFDVADRYLDHLAQSLDAWMDDPEKDTSFPRFVRYVLQKGVHDQSGSLRLHLVAAASHDDGLRQKLTEKYNQFATQLARRVAQKKPQADAGTLAWLLLCLMDGLLIQDRLGNAKLDVDDFTERMVALMEDLA